VTPGPLQAEPRDEKPARVVRADCRLLSTRIRPELPEREPLCNFIRAIVREQEQPEVQIMGKTIAEALEDEGALRGKREALLRLLRLKFKKVPDAITAEVQATQDGEQLDAWLDVVLTAKKLSAMPFQSGKKA
jgi:hypothetical protein